MPRAVTVLLIALLTSACTPADLEPAPTLKRVKTVTVGKQSTGQVRRLSGRVAAAETSTLSFGVAGTVAEISVSIGDRFKAGSVLARLEEDTLRISLDQARAQLTVARAKVKEAQQAYRRIADLHAKGASSQAEMETATADYDSARGSLRSEEANVRRKERDLTMVAIEAPFDGQVTERLAEAFEEVSASGAILMVQGDGAFEVRIAVPETLIRFIDYGQTVTVDFPSNDLTVPAVVSEISAQAEDGIAFPVSARLAGDVPDLRTGMTATVSFDVSPQKDADSPIYLIPFSALAIDAGNPGPTEGEGDNALVYLVGDDDRLELQVVRVGDVRGNELQVYAGLSAGDRVVVAGVPFLAEGMQVAIWSGELVDG